MIGEGTTLTPSGSLCLDSLASIGDYLEIDANAALTSLTGLDNLTSIGDYLQISGNGALTSPAGLNIVAACRCTKILASPRRRKHERAIWLASAVSVRYFPWRCRNGETIHGMER